MNAKHVRNGTGLNQTSFYGRIYLTQSAGSRYENKARALPKIVEAMITLAHGKPAESLALFKKLRREK